MGAIRDSLERSIDSCNIDQEKSAAPIEAARKLADLMDTPGWPMVDGRYDNVSPSTFLKYCELLGLRGTVSKEGTKAARTLSEMRKKAKR